MSRAYILRVGESINSLKLEVILGARVKSLEPEAEQEYKSLQSAHPCNEKLRRLVAL